MSEMTATRIAGLATITVLVALAAVMIPRLWATDVPGDLRLPQVRAGSYLTRAEIARRDHHAGFLRVAALLTLVAQLGALALLAHRRPRVRGRAFLQAAQLGALAGAAVFLAALPFRLAALWWERREGIVFLGYATWFWEQLQPLAEFVLVGAVAGAIAVALARRLGRRWWIPGAIAVIAMGVGVILAQPLLTPRLEPVKRPSLVRAIDGLAASEGLNTPKVEVKRVAERTRAINAAALGVGPTTRLVFWDTALQLSQPELQFLAAHELAHVARHHLWKGLVWFALLAVPAVFVLARLVRLDDPANVPRAALVAALLALAVTPFANAISRRYEAEADWIALETTRDPEAGRGLLLDLSAASLADPDPPWWSRQLFGSHPTLLERIAMTRAWEPRARGR